MNYPITTKKQIREEFWASNFVGVIRHPGWTQNDYPTDTRVAFVDYIDYLRRSGYISEELAQRATL